MSLLEEITKDRKELPVPKRRCNIGKTANKDERNIEICRRYWLGDVTQEELGTEFGISKMAVSKIIKSAEDKLKKYKLAQANYIQN